MAAILVDPFLPECNILRENVPDSDIALAAERRALYVPIVLDLNLIRNGARPSSSAVQKYDHVAHAKAHRYRYWISKKYSDWLLLLCARVQAGYNPVTGTFNFFPLQTSATDSSTRVPVELWPLKTQVS